MLFESRLVIRLGLTIGVAIKTLLAFPYHGNYVDLIRIELSALTSVKPEGCDLCKFAIIGSGALPLTSLCISDYLNKENHSVSCHNIDRSSTAISLAKTLCSTIGRSTGIMGFECADANDAEIDLSCFDVVYLAACTLSFRSHLLSPVRPHCATLWAVRDVLGASIPHICLMGQIHAFE